MNETKQEKRKKKLLDHFGGKCMLAMCIIFSSAIALLLALLGYGIVFKLFGIKNVLIFLGVFSAFYLMAHMMYNE